MSDHHDPHAHHSDMPAAFAGLAVGLVFLLIMVTTIVKLTNAKYAKHEAAAESTR